MSAHGVDPTDASTTQRITWRTFICAMCSRPHTIGSTADKLLVDDHEVCAACHLRWQQVVKADVCYWCGPSLCLHRKVQCDREEG